MLASIYLKKPACRKTCLSREMNDKRKLYFIKFVKLTSEQLSECILLPMQKLVDERDMKWKSLVLEEIEKNVDEMQRYTSIL